MPGLVPAIRASLFVDGRVTPGHDEGTAAAFAAAPENSLRAGIRNASVAYCFQNDPTEDTMRKTVIALAAIGLLTASTAVPFAAADAHEWHRGGWGHEWRGHHDNGAAIALGILGGILTTAAIASSHAAYAPPAYYYPPAAYYPAPYGYAGYGYYR